MFIALISMCIIACNDDKSKDGGKKEDSSNTKDIKPAATGNDAALTAWLGGKMFNSTNKDPKFDTYDHLKLNADGTRTDKDNASAKWKFEDGTFIFMSAMDLKNKIEKKDDSTVILHGSIGDYIYTLSPIK